MTANARPDEARQLLAAAERDRQAMVILSRDAQAPAEIVFFLAQQSLQKCIKAALAMKGLVYRRTHDLLLLESLAAGAGLAVPVGHDLLARIGPYAVEFRYVGATAPVVSLADALLSVDAALSWAASSIDRSDAAQ